MLLLMHSLLPCFLQASPYSTQIPLMFLNTTQLGTSNVCGLDHTILTPPLDALEDVS